MALIYQAGALSTTSLVNPGVYVDIVKPATVINGVSTDRIGVVGTAGWGPVNTPVVVGSMSDYIASFGPKQAASTTDAGLAVNCAIAQGASDFRVVRITDGTDTAATGKLDSTVTVTASCTGTVGNGITVMVAAAGGGYTLTASHATLGTTTYSGATWTAIAAAVAADPSAIIAVTVPTTVPAVAAGSVTLSGGTNGGTPTTANFVGTDGTSGRTGMYALRNQGCAIGVLAGLTDAGSWSAQAAFGLGEGVYMVTSGPAGDTISNAVSTLSGSGGASYALKVMFGDWLWWDDDTNGTMLVPPAAFAAGILASLSPEQSSLNKQIYSVRGSQKSGSSGTGASYSGAEKTVLFSAGIDVIATPSPGGSYWSCQLGHNSSSSSSVSGDNYTRLTHYIAETLATGMGAYIGEPINDDLFGNVRATILGYLSAMLGAGQLGLYNSMIPYTVICDSSNNPQARTAIGYVQADVSVRYMGIAEKFIVNLQGGTTVTITTSSSSS